VAAIKRKAWREVASLTPRQRALCEVAETLSATPTRMTNESWQPLRDLGFGDQALLEVAHVVGLFMYFTRLADGFGLRLDPQIEEAGERETAMVHPQRA
jgi:alkylhydroperoxidase family enzyme